MNQTIGLDQERIEVTSGDITAVFPGGVHGLENSGDEDLHIIVISVNVKLKSNASDGN